MNSKDTIMSREQQISVWLKAVGMPDESRLLGQEIIMALITDNFTGGAIPYGVFNFAREIIEAQLAKEEQYGQARVERIFRELESNAGTELRGSGLFQVVLTEEDWQALKKREGVK